MVFVPAADTVQANLRFTVSEQQIENTLYFKFNTGAPTPEDMETLGGDLVTWWVTFVDDWVSNGCQLREVYLTDLSTETAPTATFTTGLPVTGDDSNIPGPNNVSFCVSFRTNGRGRSSRGRNYIGGLPEQAYQQSTISTLTSGGLVTAYKELLKPTTFTDDWTWVVVSRYENKVPRIAALVQTVTSVLATDDIVDSQRRRLPKRGR